MWSCLIHLQDPIQRSIYASSILGRYFPGLNERNLIASLGKPFTRHHVGRYRSFKSNLNETETISITAAIMLYNSGSFRSK